MAVVHPSAVARCGFSLRGQHVSSRTVGDPPGRVVGYVETGQNGELPRPGHHVATNRFTSGVLLLGNRQLATAPLIAGNRSRVQYHLPEARFTGLNFRVARIHSGE
jgi:hypothetical protein